MEKYTRKNENHAFWLRDLKLKNTLVKNLFKKCAFALLELRTGYFLAVLSMQLKVMFESAGCSLQSP
jgi:hypothetical protein